MLAGFLPIYTVTYARVITLKKLNNYRPYQERTFDFVTPARTRKNEQTE